MMKVKLSSRLSPGAKKEFLAARGAEVFHGLLQVAPAADLPDLRQNLAAIGGTVQSWMEEARLMSVDVPARRLPEVADLKGVTYVEAGSKYSR